jgi:hypothetical protein
MDGKLAEADSIRDRSVLDATRKLCLELGINFAESSVVDRDGI